MPMVGKLWLAMFCVTLPAARVARGLGLKPHLELGFYKSFITFAKTINCFRILFAC